MSNYPPGVTGFEPQIAGYPEREATREVGACWRLGEPFAPLAPEIRWSKRSGADGVRPNRRARRITCTFEGGEIEGTLVGDSAAVTFYWDCPTCGTENDIEIDPDEFGPDPDDARDRMLDD